jgi:hypothetical protein
MAYLAMTQSTSEWLQGKTGLIDELHNCLIHNNDQVRALTASEFVEGPIRISASQNGEVVAIWNIDYLSGTGDESWGFIRVNEELGINNWPEISREVFERCMYVINQRLQGLLIDGAFYHHSYPNNAHTCLAGRGTAARQVSIGYFERSIGAGTIEQRSLICIGPSRDFSLLTKEAEKAGNELDKLAIEANSLIKVGRKRAVAGIETFSKLREALSTYTHGNISEGNENEYKEVQVATGKSKLAEADTIKSIGLDYQQWTSSSSPLSEVQRRILDSDAITKHPLRIVGPGGSGKTLLMQLLALKRLFVAKQNNSKLRILYIVHNDAMSKMVEGRFELLENGSDNYRDSNRTLDVITLAEYGRQQLGLDYTSVIDPDAYEAKLFQLEQVATALRTTMVAMPDVVANSRLFKEVQRRDDLFPIMSRLIMAEISTAIKGHGLKGDSRRYIQSERKLSRLHGILSAEERKLVYHTYERYNTAVFEELEVLDTDDIALSLLGRLRTPIWELKRRTLGYDFVFVDETQLFNENERRVLPLLTNGLTTHVPIVLALDEAQEFYGQSSAGLSTLGIPDIANESLSSVHRSTCSIVRLAFFVIQKSTDLFGPDFPDFTGIAEHMEADNHPLAAPPRVEIAAEDIRLGKFIVKRVRELRKENIRQIAVICHADQYWDTLLEDLRKTDLPLYVVLQRGERIPSDQPVVVLTRPLFAGGQEFDAVILVGLEQGIVPPRVADNDALASAMEQQSLREIYLAITRARYRVIAVLTSGASLTGVLQEAEAAKLITRRT